MTSAPSQGPRAPMPDCIETFRALHSRVVSSLGALDGGSFRRDQWTRPGGEPLSGQGVTCCLDGGRVFERAGASFSSVAGAALPAAATAARPEMRGRPFTACGVSVVVHPRNPHVPASHMNVRALSVDGEPGWFGGGFDLTPCYPRDEDVLHWHAVARDACDRFHPAIHRQLKDRCDEYFFLRHRGESRGVGGLFVDDLAPGSLPGMVSLDDCFALILAVGHAYLDAYLPIVERRRGDPYGEREREFLALRRARYVEFNLLQDRGTLFGLQSGGRTESILTSMPPVAAWRYDWRPEPGSPESRLADYLRPRDWLAELVPE